MKISTYLTLWWQIVWPTNLIIDTRSTETTAHYLHMGSLLQELDPLLMEINWRLSFLDKTDDVKKAFRNEAYSKVSFAHLLDNIEAL